MVELEHDTQACPSCEAAVLLGRNWQRKLKVIKMVASGDSNREIAETLNFARSTIKRDLAEMRASLGAENSFQLVHLATRQGLL